MNQKRISKQISYLLRHNPREMNISKEGFVDMNELISLLERRWSNLDKEDIVEIVKNDPNGRYEIENGMIRARYGHSIDVCPTLFKASVKKLYHGTTSEFAEKITTEGLKPKGRKKVHLSKDIRDAVDVGKRRTDNPVVLEIDAAEARCEGIEFEKASEKVFVADYIPPKFISISKKV